MTKRLLFISGVCLVASAVVAGAIFVWFFCRIEVEKGEFVPLSRKTGNGITSADILAPGPEFKAPQFEILQEGRHFRNPYNWYWPKPMKATVIEKGQVGVVIRRRAGPLAEGQILVGNDKQRVVLEGQYDPGRYYLNLWDYDVEIHPMVKIEPGFMGVVTRLVGKDAEDPNVLVVKKGERGVQPDLLSSGTSPELSNPYVFTVTPIDVRIRKFEMGREYGVTVSPKHGFDIRVEGTIEWAPDVANLPELFAKWADEQDLQESGGINSIQRKVVLAHARSRFRVIGRRYRAADFITGDTRIRVQNQVEARLRESCARQGIKIKSFVIRATEHTVLTNEGASTYRFEYGGRIPVEYQVLPEIESINYELTPPAYTAQPMRILTGRVSKLEGLAKTGVLVKFAASMRLAPKGCWVSWQGGARQAIDINGRFGSFAFAIGKPDRISIHLTGYLGKGFEMESPVSFNIGVQSDKRPTIRILRRERNLVKSPDEMPGFRVPWSAKDDCGIEEVKLHLKVTTIEQLTHVGRPKRVKTIVRPIRPTRDRAQGRFEDIFKGISPALALGDQIEIYLTVKDNNTKTGPGVGRSQAIKILLAGRDR